MLAMMVAEFLVRGFLLIYFKVGYSEQVCTTTVLCTSYPFCHVRLILWTSGRVALLSAGHCTAEMCSTVICISLHKLTGTRLVLDELKQDYTYVCI